MVTVLFVCMGNICRSPTATGVFRTLVERAGLADRIAVHGAGTHGYHEGERADERTRRAALERGYDLSDLRARVVTGAMIVEADYVFAMDRFNLEELEQVTPPGHGHKPELFLELVPELELSEVPDPYYGGEDGFSNVLALCEQASEALLARVRREHGL